MTSADLIVPTAAKARRVRAAATVTVSNASSRTAFVMAAVGAFAGATSWLVVEPTWTFVSAGSAVGALIGWASFLTVLAVSTYVAPPLGHRVYLLETDRGRSALVLRSDPRRGACPDDWQAYAFASWPRRRGLGRQLGEVVLTAETTAGRRVTATAWPSLARVYLRYGLVEVGRVAPGLVRLAAGPSARPGAD